MSIPDFEKYNQLVLDLFEKEKFEELACLYLEWGKRLLALGKLDEGCFFLTQGYVLALEHSMKEAVEIYEILKNHERED
ncbi:MAG: hypothetical protein OXF95_06265 [Rhodobacteraceae bacterium]|nr:hypothetical protein [Paracoccaceae bacterium]